MYRYEVGINILCMYHYHEQKKKKKFPVNKKKKITSKCVGIPANTNTTT